MSTPAASIADLYGQPAGPQGLPGVQVAAALPPGGSRSVYNYVFANDPFRGPMLMNMGSNQRALEFLQMQAPGSRWQQVTPDHIIGNMLPDQFIRAIQSGK